MTRCCNWYGTVWYVYGTVWWGMVRCSRVQYSIELYGMVQNSRVRIRNSTVGSGRIGVGYGTNE